MWFKFLEDICVGNQIKASILQAKSILSSKSRWACRLVRLELEIARLDRKILPKENSIAGEFFNPVIKNNKDQFHC